MGANKINQDFNALFISDSHALHPLNGAIHQQAKIIHAYDPEEIHIVGDGVDWEAVINVLKTKFGLKPDEMPEDFSSVFSLLEKEWPFFEIHLRARDEIFKKIEKGTIIYEEPGNHDENMDEYDGQEIEGIKIMRSAFYRASSGEKYLVEHGHRFDPGWLQRNTDWYKKGSRILDIALDADITLDRNLKYIGNNTKEVRGWLKKILRRGENLANEIINDNRFNRIINDDRFTVCETFFIANLLKTIGKTHVLSFEKEAVLKAESSMADGVICGHIHKARSEMKKRHGNMIYLNSGDGLTHATALGHRTDSSSKPLDQWSIIQAKDLKSDWSLAKEKVDPAIRRKTMEFMQAGWRACLSKVREEASALTLSPNNTRPSKLAAA